MEKESEKKEEKAQSFTGVQLPSCAWKIYWLYDRISWEIEENGS